MANKAKTGLEYFPMEVTVFADLKMRKLIKYQGGKAFCVYAYLLCSIYTEGYYIKWDDELPFMISEVTGLDEAYVREVFKCCLQVGLFNGDLFESDGVISSAGIQNRYLKICKQAKRKAQLSEFNLIPSEELNINSEGMRNNSEEMPQRKVKERKEKERKVDDERAQEFSPPPPSVPKFFTNEQNAKAALSNPHVEQICMNAGLKRDELVTVFEAFVLHRNSELKETETLPEFIRHFKNWLPKYRQIRQNTTPDKTDELIALFQKPKTT